jgi:hypothetical protein
MNTNMIKETTILTNVSLLETIVPLPLGVGPSKHIKSFFTISLQVQCIRWSNNLWCFINIGLKNGIDNGLLYLDSTKIHTPPF